ncbi:ParA family protein [Tahibacter amnicola]|uniref:ParA family protein n=1 Tax=Tahibacter amnicola TaxID=2976241 RepID=A0ABY6BKZ6_9GAMM|nr:ParA family protein [Tahibacter amnicola]UXI68472.1 ParA family protein [Tahibacter amnicola]
MRKVLIASCKGGCGKTTLATHLAAHDAIAGFNTVLVDCDRLAASRHWCERRAGMASAVLPIDGTRRGWRERIPDGAQRVIIDTAAGSTVEDIEGFLDFVDAVLVPVLPSPFDLEASSPFVQGLAQLARIKRDKVGGGLVANRLRPWTHGTQLALEQMRQMALPVVAEIRDTQGYVMATGLGKSLFDYHSEAVRGHQDDWKPLLRWLKKHD